MNQDAINTAKSLYPNVKFIKGDIIGSDDVFQGKADVVVCYNIIEHLSREKRGVLFNKINESLLNDNGIIIFGYANPWHPVQLLWGFLTQKVLFDKTHVFNWSKKGFREIIGQNFKIILEKDYSPFTKFIWLGKYFKGDILICAKKK